MQDTARRGKDAGLPPLEIARKSDLGAFANWADKERIIGIFIVSL